MIMKKRNDKCTDVLFDQRTTQFLLLNFIILNRAHLTSYYKVNTEDILKHSIA